MAMTNRRSGGLLIIGVPETASGLSFDGLTPEQLVTWKYESIADGFNSYTSSPIEFDCLEYKHEGRTFLILDIHEFATTPVICIKEYRDKTNPRMPEAQCRIILYPGAFYIRTVNKPESKQMLTSEEVRILFELANEKAVRSFVMHTKLAGINITPAPEDKVLFAQQLQGWTGPILEEIRSRGYWDIYIRPVTFQRERLPLLQLRPLIIQASLNYRSGEFPSVTSQAPKTGLDWIGSEYQKDCNLQAWRFFQSGQFAAAAGLIDDWGDKLTYPFQGVPKPGKVLSILDVTYRLTEIYGLASRLATTDIYRDERSIIVDITLHKIKGRILLAQGTNITTPSHPPEAGAIPYTTTLPKEDIIAHPRELAIKAAQYIFERFGLDLSDQLLTTIQSGLSIHR